MWKRDVAIAIGIDPVIKVPGDERPWYVTFGEVPATDALFHSFPVDESHAFTFWPNGERGESMEIEFVMRDGIERGHPSFAVILDVEDDQVVVSGPAITGGERSFIRYATTDDK